MTRAKKTLKKQNQRYQRKLLQNEEYQNWLKERAKPGYVPNYYEWATERSDQNNPLTKAYKAEAAAARGKQRVVSCAWGTCNNFLDKRGRITDGFGAVGCPCDSTPGWRSKYPAGQSKPHMPVKAIGRHGSRVQRAKQRHKDVVTLDGYQIMSWMRDIYLNEDA